MNRSNTFYGAKMDQNFTIRISKSLMDRISGYAQAQELKRAEAIRNLIEIGLKVCDIKESGSSEIDEEFKRMQVEAYFRQSQQYLLSVSEIDKEEIQSNAAKVKASIQKKYPEIYDKYYGDPMA